MRQFSKIIFIVMLVITSLAAKSQSHFFRQYWMPHTPNANNNQRGDDRTRVNDRRINTDEWAMRIPETQGNGMELVNIADSLFYMERAEVCIEMYGGHAGAANKGFRINGGQLHLLTDKGTASNNSSYLCPTVPIEFRDLVTGYNAFQFVCERGISGWAHFMVDEMAVRCYLKPNHPSLQNTSLGRFTAMPATASKVIGDKVKFNLSYPSNAETDIVAVHYFARYLGFDDNGSESEYGWHGYTHDRKFTNHLGTVTKAPFAVEWNTRMIPNQARPMAVKALVELKDGIFYWTEVLDGLSFPFNRPTVQLYSSADLPTPFWSRDNQVKTAHIELPADLSAIESVELHTRVWDGGKGTTQNPFTLNGHVYTITTGYVPYDLFYTINAIDPKHLVPGLNVLTLSCNNEGHGVEISLPGPCLIVRYKK